MADPSIVSEYVDSLCASKRLGFQVVFHRTIDRVAARYADCADLFSPRMERLLQKMGIKSLYTHQAEAIKAVFEGKNVVVSTPTASGKTLVYNLPVISRIRDDPESRAIYLFPLKALAQKTQNLSNNPL